MRRMIVLWVFAFLASGSVAFGADYEPKNHGGADLTLQTGDRVWGVHTNIRNFAIGGGQTITVRPYEAATTGSGFVEINAANITIHGALDASGAGHEGGSGGGGGGGNANGSILVDVVLGSGRSAGAVSRDGAQGASGQDANILYYIGGSGGNGGAAAGPLGGAAGVKGVCYDFQSGGSGTAGGDGRYAVNDTTVDESLQMGSGGGGGGGGAGGSINNQDVNQAAGGGGGGGGGGAGGGYMKLYATTSIDLQGGAVLARGTRGGDGEGGAGGWAGYLTVVGGDGGHGGSTTLEASGLGGGGGYSASPAKGGGSGGAGGSGGGGGILLKCAVYDATNLTGATLDVDSGTTPGGTVKIFYAGAIPSTGAYFNARRFYIEHLGPHVRYVKVGGVTVGAGDSWANAWDLPTVFANSLTSETIKIAEGTYNVTGAPSASAGQTWLGGYPATGAPTDADRDPAAHPVVFDANNGGRSGFQIQNKSGVTIDGFTFKRGYQASNPGGALYVKGATGLTISNCSFLNNSAADGGAVHVEGGSVSATDARFDKCVFAGNAASGAGAAVYVIRHASEQPVQSSLVNCLVSGNASSVDDGALAVNGAGGAARLDAINCTLVANTWSGHGGLSLPGATLFGNATLSSLVNTLIDATSATAAIEFVQIAGTTPTLNNNCLYGAGAALSVQGGATTTYTIAQLNATNYADNNIDDAPNFINKVSGNYRLAGTSQCIDWGTNAGAPSVDLAGRHRPIDVPGVGYDGANQGYDMGAYEYWPPIIASQVEHWRRY